MIWSDNKIREKECCWIRNYIHVMGKRFVVEIHFFNIASMKIPLTEQLLENGLIKPLNQPQNIY